MRQEINEARPVATPSRAAQPAPADGVEGHAGSPATVLDSPPATEVRAKPCTNNGNGETTPVTPCANNANGENGQSLPNPCANNGNSEDGNAPSGVSGLPTPASRAKPKMTRQENAENAKYIMASYMTVTYSNCFGCFGVPPDPSTMGVPLEELLKQAAKQRLRRFCASKKKRQSLQAPEWVINEWQKGDKGQLAQMFMDCNWSKAGSNGFHHLT